MNLLRRLLGSPETEDDFARPFLDGQAPAEAVRLAPEPPPAALPCPSCAVLLSPPPVGDRRCPRCRQPIIVRRLEGRTVLLNEAAVEVFKAERRRAAEERVQSAARQRWLRLAHKVNASPNRCAKLAAAPVSSDVVEASRALYLATVERADQGGAARRAMGRHRPDPARTGQGPVRGGRRARLPAGRHRRVAPRRHDRGAPLAPAARQGGRAGEREMLPDLPERGRQDVQDRGRDSCAPAPARRLPAGSVRLRLVAGDGRAEASPGRGDARRSPASSRRRRRTPGPTLGSRSLSSGGVGRRRERSAGARWPAALRRPPTLTTCACRLPWSSSTRRPTSPRTSRPPSPSPTQAAAGGARLVALPEYLQYRGADDGFRASARPIPGPHTEPFAEVARRRDAWILVGSTAETSADPDRPFNSSALIAPDGSIAARLPQASPLRRGGRRRTQRHRVGSGDGRRSRWSPPRSTA